MVYTSGVPNLARVDAPSNVWRSGQVTTPEGWVYLRSLGVKHVVKLNAESEGSDQGALDAGMDVTYLPIEPEGGFFSIFKAPDTESIRLAAHLLVRPDTLVHCTHGQDRTGIAVGAYRMLVDGWHKSSAWHEMIDHNYHWELPALTAWWLWSAP
jgi:hypothetical protein